MYSVRTPKIAWPTILGVVATVGVFSFVLDRRYDTSLAAVHDSLAMRAAIDETLSLLKDAETGQRGFILTGDEPHAPSALEALMESADRAMYEEKRGRARSHGQVECRA